MGSEQPPFLLYVEVSSFQGVSLYYIIEVSSFQWVGIEEFHCILISVGWNRGVPLYTEVSSFQGVGIEGFHSF